MRIFRTFLPLLLFSATLLGLAQTTSGESPKPESAQSLVSASKVKVPPGGVEILSDTQGVDLGPWLKDWRQVTDKTWDPLKPDEVKPPALKSGLVAIRFKVLPNGRLAQGSMVLESRSGDVALDRAAWGALTGSDYPALPSDFKGPYLEMRAYFLYNVK
jgi:hypothetical protein